MRKGNDRLFGVAGSQSEARRDWRQVGTWSWRALYICPLVTYLPGLSFVPSPELNLCWKEHSEEGETVPSLEELINPLPG